jgi:hypothetical protein
MNNEIFMSGILSVSLLLSAVSSEFLTFTTPNAFGQQAMLDSIYENKEGSAIDTTHNDNNNNKRDYGIVAVSTNDIRSAQFNTTGTNDSSVATSSNMSETIPRITVVDVVNSTYIASKEVGENESERRIGRAIRDRINDTVHTVVMSNATIISTATITNNFVDESISTSNYTRLLEIIPEQVEIALTLIRDMPQSANSQIELHSDIEMVCIANNTSLADCDMNIRIR